MGKRLDDESRAIMRDSFAEDMAEHQRMHGQMPTPAENQALTVPLFEEIEKKIADDPDRQSVESQPPDPERPRKVDQRAKERGLRVVRKMSGPNKNIAAALGAEKKFAELLQKRVSLLLEKRDSGPLGQPSWHDRVMAELFSYKLGDPHATEMLIEICEESNAYFGDWKKEEAKKSVFS